MDLDIKEIVKEYIKENLKVETRISLVDTGLNTDVEEKKLEISLMLDGEEISNDCFHSSSSVSGFEIHY